MTTPKQGFLVKSNENEWSFLPGHSLNACSKRNNPCPSIPLPNFTTNAESLYYSKQLVNGWKQFQQVIQDYNIAKSQTFIARRVTYFQTSDPFTLTDDSTQKAIQLDIKICGHSRKISAAALSSNLEPKLHEHHLPPPRQRNLG